MQNTYQNHFNQLCIAANPRVVARIYKTANHETYNETEALRRMENEGGIAPPKVRGAKLGTLYNSSNFFGNMVLHRWHDLPSMTLDVHLFETR